MNKEQILRKPEIIEMLLKEGVELKQKGRLWWACCSLHQERTPSFAVDPEKQRFHCFGCHAGGDSIDFIMKYRGLSFLEALQYLGINGDTRPSIPAPQEQERRELLQKFRRWEQLYRRAICELLRLANRVDLFLRPEDLELPGIGEMYLRKCIYEHHISILNGDDDKAKFELYKEVVYGND